MTSLLKNVYIDKLDDIVNEYNNTYHRAIKMKPVDVKDLSTGVSKSIVFVIKRAKFRRCRVLPDGVI